MLIEFKTRNFRSFKEETSFLMTKVKSFKEHLDTNIIKTDREFDLLKSAAIYGSNASGKSNFIVALGMMSDIIFDSFSNSLKKEEDRPNYNFQFKLSSATENDNTMFEVSFLKGAIIYRYGFEINGHEIKKEWLYRKHEREIPLFVRVDQEFEINKESFPEGERYKSEVNSNVLFLSHLSQYNQPLSKQVLKWFSKIAVISGSQEHIYEKFTVNLLKENANFKNWAAIVLKYLEISNIEAGQKDGEIITYHNKYDGNNLLIGAIPFDRELESEGTKKLIHILGPVYVALKDGNLLLIDEFDCQLHPNLSKKLVHLFQEFNKRTAQFIFSAQDTNLLDKDLLRRDQIWFVEKNQFGASSLYSLSEFNANTVRNTSAYDKKYLENIFGAADTFEITTKLMELLYAS